MDVFVILTINAFLQIAMEALNLEELGEFVMEILYLIVVMIIMIAIRILLVDQLQFGLIQLLACQEVMKDRLVMMILIAKLLIFVGNYLISQIVCV